MDTRRMFGKKLLALGAGLAGVRHGWAAQAGTALSTAAEFTGDASLRAHADQRGLSVGMAVNMPLLARDPVYAQTIIDQCNLVVAENAMKWAALRPAPDSFDFTAADRLMAFAAANAMQVRGHNLCWHEALPPWFARTVTKANAEQVLTRHIATVAGRYKGKIRAWDVVNEAVDPRDGLPGGLRNSPWYKLLGPGYLDIAFRAARAADPGALLTYNDYGIETDGAADTAKRAAVLGLLQRMKRDSVPIDAVGIQSHLSADSAGNIGAGLASFVQQCAAMGLQVFITELDVNDDGLSAEDPAERARQVGTIYTNYLTLLLKNPAVTDVLTWGVADRYSWLNAGVDAPQGANAATPKFRPRHPKRAEQCLPFNDAYQPNPAFYAERAALDTARRR